MTASCAVMDPGRQVELAPPDPQRCVETAIRRGVVPESEELAHFERRCAAGDAAACSIIGVVSQRSDPARSWYLYGRACHAGNARACANLAQLFERAGSSRDALALYDHACRHDVPEACTA